MTTVKNEACKRLLANKQILAWILKNCVEEFRDYSIKEIAEKYVEGTPEVAEKAVEALKIPAEQREFYQKALEEAVTTSV